MFNCAHCHHVFIVSSQTGIERDTGDWILPCPECGAKNVLAAVVVDHVVLPVLQIVGWRN